MKYKTVTYFNGYKLKIINPSSRVTNQNDLEVFYDLIKDIPNCRMLDIGANKGYYSLLTTLKSDLKSYAFEPLSNVVNRFLVKNIVLNKAKNIEVFNYGFLDKQCFLKMWYDNTENASISKDIDKEKELKSLQVRYDNFTSNRYKIKEKVGIFVKLDGAPKEIKKKINVVKIDVEGSELQVLKGGREFFKKNLPMIFVEIEERHCKRFNVTVKQVLNYLKRLGYTNIKNINNNYIIKK